MRERFLPAKLTEVNFSNTVDAYRSRSGHAVYIKVAPSTQSGSLGNCAPCTAFAIMRYIICDHSMNSSRFIS